MGKVKDELLFGMIRNYFTVYLPSRRMASPHTIETYRRVWNQYLNFVEDRNHVKLKDINVEMLDKDTLGAYLDYLSGEKHAAASTWNLQLSAIRSFFEYASACNPVYMSLYSSLSQFRYQKKDTFAKVDYMTEDAVHAILSVPDTSTVKGMRNQFLMILLYDTAARIQELLDIRLKDLKIGKVSSVVLHGKGGKTRVVPITDNAATRLKEYLELFHPGEPTGSGSDEFLFYVERKGKRSPMNDDTVRIFMQKYADKAKENCPAVPESVHPHLWRHSRAMHLYQHGMPLEMISQFLGHAEVETTLVYAHADTEMKRKAITKAIGNEAPAEQEGIYKVTNESLIRKLYGL